MSTDGDREILSAEQGRMLMRAVGGQEGLGLVFLDADLRITYSHVSPAYFPGLAAPLGGSVEDLIPPDEAEAVTTRLRHVLSTGHPLPSGSQRLRAPCELVVSLSALAVRDAYGRPAQLILLFTQADRESPRRRQLDLLFDAASTIGTSLDVTTAAQQLVDALVPELGDAAGVALAMEVWVGDDPPQRIRSGVMGMRRAALAPADHAWPEGFLLPGSDLPPMPDSPELRRLQRGEAIHACDRRAITALVGDDPGLVQRIVPPRATSMIQSPLLSRGLLLGSVLLWRFEGAEPFTKDDMRLLQAITSRAALSVDNARRFTREHTSVVTLQRSMLPGAATHTQAVQTAGTYLPATVDGSGSGGDWYDVIPLSSLRTALVVGDIVGHGLSATATMGRMRTAVQALADLDLRPDELLIRLDELVLRLIESTEAVQEGALGSTCLFAVYDPVDHCCTVASAGHPPPALVRPDGTVEFVTLSPGPPLGVGGLPFEAVEMDLEPGSVLVLYSDGLVKGENDIDKGLDRLRSRLESLQPAGDDLAVMASRVVSGVSPVPRTDDVILLLARALAVPERDVASWPIPADPSAVADARDLVTDQLAAWDLDQIAFTTELVVSELVTNALRHAGGPITLRLIRDSPRELLVCEVSDPSNTQPRLRHARSTDEGGRGLYLVAQLTSRWGSRFRSSGKTVWAEQPWAGQAAPADAALAF